MSGFYDITRFTGGYDYATAYYNNPMEFIANELYPRTRAAIRKLDIILAVGQDDPLAEDNHRLSE